MGILSKSVGTRIIVSVFYCAVNYKRKSQTDPRWSGTHPSISPRRLLLVLFYTLILNTAPPISAQENASLGGIQSDSFKSLADGTTIYRGNVRIDVPGLFLITADEARYAPESRILDMTGNIKIDYFSSLGLIEATAHRMTYSAREKSGSLEEVTVEFNGEFFFVGARLEILDPEHFVIEDGVLSTCNQPIPQWSLLIKRATVEREGYAVIKNATFKLKKLPIFYVPYMIVPAMQERRTGLLPPVTGNTERNGSYYGQPFYWAPRDDFDLTITPTIFDKAGFKADLEGRYHIREDLYGDFYGQFLEDRIIEKAEAAGNAPTEAGNPIPSNRYRVHAQHQQSLFNGRFKVDVESGSDFFFDRDFLRDPGRARLRDYFYRLRFDKDFGSNHFSIHVAETERILVNTRGGGEAEAVTELDQQPELRFFMPTRHLGAGFYLYTQSYLNRIQFKNLGPNNLNDTVWRVGLDSEVSKTRDFGPYLHARWGAVIRGAYYETEDAGDKETKGGGVAFIETSGPRLSKTYRLKGRRLVHQIDPGVKLTYGTREEDPFLEAITFDELDIRINRQKDNFQATWRFNSRLFLGDTNLIRPLMELEIRQDVDFDSQSETNEPIDARLRLLNMNGFNVNSIFSYNTDSGSLDTISVYANVNSGIWSGYAGYVRRTRNTPTPQDSLIGISQLQLSTHSKIKFDFEYDFLNSEFKSRELKYGYQGQCLGFNVHYVKSPFTSSKGVEEDFLQLSLSFRNLGDVGTRF